MGGLMPKAPPMPSADEQYAIQKRLQDQAETEATTKAEKERRKAALDQKRRTSGKSLITPRSGGLFGTLYPDEETTSSSTGSLFKS
jgi:hypothetical protein